VGSATTDVTLKMKSFPCYFLPVALLRPKSAPVIFFRGISLEILMESAFVDDIAGIFDPFLRSPLYFALLFFPPEISQWRRVRIRLHPQAKSLGELRIRCRGSNPAAPTAQSDSHAYGIASRSKCLRPRRARQLLRRLFATVGHREQFWRCWL
jgi:hypothetical protein